LARPLVPGAIGCITHDYSGARYAPLAQIDSSNAKRLQVACAFQVGELANFQTGPIVYQGTMYVTTPRSTIVLNASNCRPKWRQSWEPKTIEPFGPHANRGVAIKDGRIVRGTLDGCLLELNAQTGELIWARKVSDVLAGETFTMAPMIFEDLILIGPAGSETGISGWVGAFRLSDGTEVWRFKTVPGVDEFNSQSWKNPTGIRLAAGRFGLHSLSIRTKGNSMSPSPILLRTCLPDSALGTTVIPPR
jgi:alcohol dehydrogenase (cytochrome c)